MRHIDELDKEIKKLQSLFSGKQIECEYWRAHFCKQKDRADTLAEAIINSETDRNIQLDHT